MNKPRTLEQWKKIVQTARESGLTDKDWCIENDVNVNTFYYNVKRLRKLSCEPPRQKQLPEANEAPPQPVVPVEIIDEPMGASVQKNLPSTSEYKIHDRRDAEEQASVIQIEGYGLQISITNRASTNLVEALVGALGGQIC
jgi:hypothetical protein